MLIAKNDKGEWCSALEKSVLEQKYFCPDCHQAVYLKNGAQRLSHFAHYKKCEQSSFSEGESMEHLAGKQLLVEWAEKLGYTVKLEPYLPNLKQRPDVLLEHVEQKIALEFQCSPISSSTLMARTIGYQQNGYTVYWIVGEKHAQYLTSHLMSFYHDFSLIYLQTKWKKLFVKTIMGQKEITLKQLLEQNLPPLNYSALLYSRKRQLRLPFLKLMYQERLPILSVPIALHFVKCRIIGLQWNMAEWLSWLYYVRVVLNLDKNSIYKLCRKWEQAGKINYDDMPLIPKEKQIQFLIEQGLVRLQQLKLIE